MAPVRLRLRLSEPSSLFLVEELIIQILSWLPVKSLIRFKCVSQSWKSLISHPSFIQLHLSRSPKIPHLIIFSHLGLDLPPTRTYLCYPVRNLTYFLQNPISIPFHHSHYLQSIHNYTVLGSCNGLVCLLYHELDRDHHVLFWNPATRLISQKLPCFSFVNGSDCFKFGFGYDNSSDTYKLVVLRFNFSLNSSAYSKLHQQDRISLGSSSHFSQLSQHSLAATGRSCQF